METNQMIFSSKLGFSIWQECHLEKYNMFWLNITFQETTERCSVNLSETFHVRHILIF